MFYLGIVFRSVRYGEQHTHTHTHHEDVIQSWTWKPWDHTWFVDTEKFFFYSTVLWCCGKPGEEILCPSVVCIGILHWNCWLTCAHRSSSNRLESKKNVNKSDWEKAGWKRETRIGYVKIGMPPKTATRFILITHIDAIAPDRYILATFIDWI